MVVGGRGYPAAVCRFRLLPSAVATALADAAPLQDADFEIRSVEAMREHYARTAEHWIATLADRFDEFVALQGEEVARVWRLYLVGGMLAFEEGRMGVDQILAAKTPVGDR
jgi:cyclopropane-fatty-acyl-phospholipid synthase